VRAARKRFSLSLSVFVFCAAFLFLPLLVLIAYSFNEGKSALWTGFSLKWYAQLFTGSREIWRAFNNSMSIALSSALCATAIGTLGAIGVAWYKFRLKAYVRLISFMPLIMPEIVLGVSLLVFFTSLRMQLGWWSIFIAHTTFCLPFTFLMVQARLEEFDYSVIEAAYDCGATESQTLFRVIIPMILPGIISGFLTALTLSLEDFVITFFVSGAGSATLPIKVYGEMMRGGISPVINALSAILILGTVSLSLLAKNFLKYIAAQ
jgi:spermidine/putrescine transport system permease protein